MCFINVWFQGSLVTCEFLLQNAANVNQQDAQGRGPLHHATMLGHTGFVFHISSSLPHQTPTPAATWIMFYPPKLKKELIFLFQTSVFILKKRSKSKCCRHRWENTFDNSGGGGQCRHRHTVSPIIVVIGIIIFTLGDLSELSTQPTTFGFWCSKKNWALILYQVKHGWFNIIASETQCNS